MKIQKSVTFVKKNLKINIWKINNIVKLEIIVIIQGIHYSENRGPADSICNLKYSVPKRVGLTIMDLTIMDLSMIIILSKES